MWVVMGDEWYERAFNRRKYNEAHSEQGLALPTLLRQQSGREARSAESVLPVSKVARWR
jgi:hypothetical protein